MLQAAMSLPKEKGLKRDETLQAKYPARSGVFRKTKIGACTFYLTVLRHPSGQLLNAKSAFKEVLPGASRPSQLFAVTQRSSCNATAYT
jgi:hypothetical protein